MMVADLAEIDCLSDERSRLVLVAEQAYFHMHLDHTSKRICPVRANKRRDIKVYVLNFRPSRPVRPTRKMNSAELLRRPMAFRVVRHNLDIKHLPATKRRDSIDDDRSSISVCNAESKPTSVEFSSSDKLGQRVAEQMHSLFFGNTILLLKLADRDQCSCASAKRGHPSTQSGNPFSCNLNTGGVGNKAYAVANYCRKSSNDNDKEPNKPQGHAAPRFSKAQSSSLYHLPSILGVAC